MIMERLDQVSEPIRSIEVYRYDVNVQRNFSHGAWTNRIHGFIRISAGNRSGWGENIMAVNRVELDLNEWLSPLQDLIGMTIGEAVRTVMTRLTELGSKRAEMVETALLDLAGQLLGLSALELLGLDGKEPVPGLFCILENDPQKVRERAQESWDQGYRTHLKVKLFGDTDLDKTIVEAARGIMGPETFIVGDVNNGYRRKKSEESLEEIAAALRSLQEAGLNACEDPANLTAPQWIELQSQAGELELLPDEPLRPAIEAARTVLPGMGGIYNIHPGCAGSLIHAVELARKIQGFGARLMIGDDSLVGPACTVWQQLAIGLSADWVESLEKPGESDAFEACVTAQATSRTSDGRVSLGGWSPGFGLMLDEKQLRNCSSDYGKLEST
ncbi:enolase C-terminal domain-like protein [Paenibacillus sp. NPDC056579]|uniref:enolase C-terminal domain-like protein n=1 Tax=Paenibacillus sp. NPDC056579 TaxID=3345871 RepID=UPI0036AA3468